MEVGLFAAVHNPHLLMECGWYDNKIISLFDKFKPDIICGEVRQTDYQNNASYQGPGEYRRFIFDYCKDRNVQFIPCDWFDEETIAANQIDEMADADKDILNKYNYIVEKYVAVGKSSSIPFNCDEFNNLVREKQKLQEKANPDIHKIVWTTRNNNIMKNILNVISENHNKRILIVFGAEHIYWIEDTLKKSPDIQLIFPLKRNNKTSEL